MESGIEMTRKFYGLWVIFLEGRCLSVEKGLTYLQEPSLCSHNHSPPSFWLTAPLVSEIERLHHAVCTGQSLLPQLDDMPSITQ